MSFYVDKDSIQLSDEKDLAGAWMDFGVVDEYLIVDVTGSTTMDLDNYPTSSFESVRLNLDDAIALRGYLDEAIEQLRNRVE